MNEEKFIGLKKISPLYKILILLMLFHKTIRIISFVAFLAFKIMLYMEIIISGTVTSDGGPLADLNVIANLDPKI